VIVFGLEFYDQSKPIYLQSIVFWILVFIPCTGAYEYFWVIIIKKVFAKYIDKQNAPEKPKKRFQDKLDEIMNQTK